ncbi:MAG: dimethylarginine dimethylaminohydrolase family protein [Roseiflexaceae bacterium]
MSILNSAHGGNGWQGRDGSLAMELGSIWGKAGVTTEVGRLRSVLMHRPANELAAVTDPAPVLWNDLIEQELATYQHDQLAETYRRLGVEVYYMRPGERATPNLYFARDHFFMTPQGAIISRMGSAARAGEERFSAAMLAELGVPILMSVHGTGTFEGADIVYLDQGVVLVSFGMRSNREGCRQVAAMLSDIGMEPAIVEMPYGTGHIDGGLSIVDRRKAIVRPYHCPYGAIEQLRRLGYDLIEVPDEAEAANHMAINLVPIAPGVVVMPAGNPKTERILASHGIECHPVDVSELMKGGGAVHCMTGVIHREAI